MSQYWKLGGLGVVVLAVAFVVGIAAPMQAAKAMTGEGILGVDSGAIPANDFDIQSATIIAHLDAGRSLSQAQIIVNCGSSRCGTIGWSERLGWQEPNAAAGYGNEHIRFMPNLSTVELSEDGLTATLMFIWAHRPSYGTVGRNTVSYMLRDNGGGMVPMTNVPGSYAVRNDDSVYSTLQDLTLDHDEVFADDTAVQVAHLTIVPGTESTELATARIGINRYGQELGSITYNPFGGFQKTAGNGSEFIRLVPEQSSFHVNEDGTWAVDFAWTVLPTAPLLSGNTITYYFSEKDNGYVTESLLAEATFDIVAPPVVEEPVEDPVEEPIEEPPVEDPGEEPPVEDPTLPTPGSPVFIDSLAGTPGDNVIHLAWSTVDPYSIPGFSGFTGVNGVAYYASYWIDGEDEANADSIFISWPPASTPAGQTLSGDLLMNPADIDPALTPEEFEEIYGYEPILNGNTYHVRLIAEVPSSGGGFVQAVSNVVTVTPMEMTASN